mgnify:CR=1 FL=1
MGKYFGTDGFRGEANVDLTVMHAFEIGRYLGWYYGKDKKARVVIGKDTRRSSYMLESALCAGLTASGADAYLLHVTTTPSVSYVARADDFDCGIMISASHNPYYDNGIKLINGKGEKMGDELLNEIEAYIDRASAGEKDCLPYATGEKIGRTVDYSAGRNRYIGFLISLATRSYKGKKVGLDCANGSTWMMAKSVFDALGADTYVISNNPDGININVNCGSTHIEQMQKFVLANKLDVGFAFDGDADRCLAVDEKGNIITGDHILYVCGKYMRDSGILGEKKIVTTVMSNMGLYRALDALGIGYEKTAVGDKYVAENMRANGYILGGEQSGVGYVDEEFLAAEFDAAGRYGGEVVRLYEVEQLAEERMELLYAGAVGKVDEYHGWFVSEDGIKVVCRRIRPFRPPPVLRAAASTGTGRAVRGSSPSTCRP